MGQVGKLTQGKDDPGYGGIATVSQGWGPGILAFAVFFVLFVADSVLKGRVPVAVLGLYLVSSTLAFYLYKRDRVMGISHQRRISENTLHCWSLLGGWPGAALAQKLLHHQSRKRSFQVVYWFTVVLNSLGFFWLLSSPGSAQLRSLLDGLKLR
jgi:uncharacterized membrane protein YsdA (DUF1294 family)